MASAITSAASSHSGRGSPTTSASAAAAAQGVLDARRAGEQGVVPRPGAVGLDRPQHEAVGPAQRQHPVERPLDGRPQVVEEPAVPRAAPVVPHAGGDVGAHVGVELGLLDAAVGPVVVVPAAVRALRRGQPLVGVLGLRGAGRRRRGPSPTRRGSTGRSGRRGTTGSSRSAPAATPGARRWRAPPRRHQHAGRSGTALTPRSPSTAEMAARPDPARHAAAALVAYSDEALAEHG